MMPHALQFSAPHKKVWVLLFGLCIRGGEIIELQNSYKY